MILLKRSHVPVAFGNDVHGANDLDKDDDVGEHVDDSVAPSDAGGGDAGGIDACVLKV